MNLVLMRKGYPPALILTVDRKRYYRVLQEADRDRLGAVKIRSRWMTTREALEEYEAKIKGEGTEG